MLKQIQQTNNSFAKKQVQTNSVYVSQKPCFSANEDTFSTEKSTNEKKEKSNKLKLFLMTGLGVLAAGYTHTRFKLGQMIKLTGEKVPMTLYNRLKKVSEILSKDPMTGLFNKRSLLVDLANGFKRKKSQNSNFGVAMLDMDNFKAINEVFSHGVGDTVLKRIAANIKEVAQMHGAKGYRYGGEEFVVAMENHDTESAKKIVQEIADAIKKDKIIQSYVPEFTEKANGQLQCIAPILTKFHSIFSQLRGVEKINDYRQLGNEIISLLEAHIKQTRPTQRKIYNEIIANIKTAKDEDLPALLKIGTKCSNGETLGNELDKVFLQYNGLKNDLKKWIGHIDTHRMFTVSGGFVNLGDVQDSIREGKQLVCIADAALKAAKENGKNCIVFADKSLVQNSLM